MNRELMEALYVQAECMKANLSSDPTGPFEGRELIVTGFVFRPATKEETLAQEQADPLEGRTVWIYEVHFLVRDHPSIHYTTTQLIIDLPVQTYEEASEHMLTLLERG